MSINSSTETFREMFIFETIQLIGKLEQIILNSEKCNGACSKSIDIAWARQDNPRLGVPKLEMKGREIGIYSACRRSFPKNLTLDRNIPCVLIFFFWSWSLVDSMLPAAVISAPLESLVAFWWLLHDWMVEPSPEHAQSFAGLTEIHPLRWTTFWHVPLYELAPFYVS